LEIAQSFVLQSAYPVKAAVEAAVKAAIEAASIASTSASPVQ
jgi:hypothetical protein